MARWPGGLIRKTPVTPAGPYQNGAASGVWSLADAAYWTKQGLWPIAGNTNPIGLFGGGSTSSDFTNVISYINIASTGNATSFGILTARKSDLSAVSSATRGVFGGGTFFNGFASSYYNVLEYVTIATTGNATDFGDLSAPLTNQGSCASSTRGLFGAGSNYASGSNSLTAKIEYITIATTGNALNFGNVTQARTNLAACSSTTRGVFGGGFTTVRVNTIDYVTIATTGNATDFGDLAATGGIGNADYNLAACSSNTRGLFGGGSASTGNTNVVQYITIATTGNTTDFGDLTSARPYLTACSSPTRGVFAGGVPSGYINVIDYVTIATTGNATDFGDLTASTGYLAGCSNAHGGL